MKPHKTVVERGDTCKLLLDIRVIQPEGWFEYIPAGDTISVFIKNKANEIIRQNVIAVPPGNEEKIMIDMPTDLEKGEYSYDIIINTSDGEKHTICDEYIFKIKEDRAHA